ncbi:MAG: SGNH/GDSL hydrolase family protein [Burkholderiaceae bacterium]|nr:SGNH/GDSL hydrolase family protein [Burkholderiaceae bacterium]
MAFVRMRPWMFETTCAPLLMLQGRHVRRVTPQLPEAQGDRAGLAGIGAGCGTRTVRLLIAGDSSAAGVGVSRVGDAMAGVFPEALAARLACAVCWQLVARTGLTAAGVLELIEREPGLDRGFDAAVVVVGVNDVTGRHSRARWLADLDALRARLRTFAPRATLHWSGLPPMHRFPALPNPLRAYLGARARLLDTELARWVARDATMRHLPIPALSGEGMMATDGFHPGPRGHRLWGELLAGAVADDLRRQAA